MAFLEEWVTAVAVRGRDCSAACARCRCPCAKCIDGEGRRMLRCTQADTADPALPVRWCRPLEGAAEGRRGWASSPPEFVAEFFGSLSRCLQRLDERRLHAIGLQRRDRRMR